MPGPGETVTRVWSLGIQDYGEEGGSVVYVKFWECAGLGVWSLRVSEQGLGKGVLGSCRFWGSRVMTRGLLV